MAARERRLLFQGRGDRYHEHRGRQVVEDLLGRAPHEQPLGPPLAVRSEHQQIRNASDNNTLYLLAWLVF